VLSLSLNTRDVSSAAAKRIWERHAPSICTLARGALVYQKIDSTLRGHPGLEVHLLLGYLGASAALIAPAFPKLGRQTIDGVHRVHGVPVAETDYAVRRTPATSHLPDILTCVNAQRPVHLLRQVIEAGAPVVTEWLQARLAEPSRLITADAADERHLDILTQAVLPLGSRVLLVGSAGWAERLALACKGSMATGHAAPGALGVVGSLSAIATQQVQVALQAGMTVVRLPAPAAIAGQGETAHRQALTRALASGQSAVIWTGPGDLNAVSRAAGRRVLRALALLVRPLLSTTPVSGLVIVGGDTTQTVLGALRSSGLVLEGEVETGVPYGRLADGPFAGLPTITKAGGFGAPTTLVEGLRFLQRWATQ
jgi:uncharacterized protein YgbK (DUF1537 family)